MVRNMKHGDFFPIGTWVKLGPTVSIDAIKHTGIQFDKPFQCVGMSDKWTSHPNYRWLCVYPDVVLALPPDKEWFECVK